MAWSHTQSRLSPDGTATSATTLAFSFLATVSNNGLVVGTVMWGDATITCTGVADDKSNTYTLLNPKSDAGAGVSAVSFYKEGITNGPITITATFSATVAFRRMVIGEYAGIATSSAIDGSNAQVQTSPATGADTLNSLTATTTGSGDLIWGSTLDGTGSGNTLSAGTSPNAFTARANGTSADNTDMMAEDFSQTSAGSIEATAGCTAAAHDFITHMMAFKIAGAGAAVPQLINQTSQAVKRASYW